MSYILELYNISKTFGGIKAVSNFNCKVKENNIHAIIGPNGAGKTTIFNMISGIYKPTSGSILLKGKNIAGQKPNIISLQGVGRTFQTLKLFKNLTVWENIFIAYKTKEQLSFFEMVIKGGKDKLPDENEHLNNILKLLNIEDKKDILAKNLSYGDQRRLEIARALAGKPIILLLDEPTCGMNPNEANAMVSTINNIKKENMTILLVEHNMRVVMGISDYITVVDFGNVIAEGKPSEVKNNKKVIAAYLGDRNVKD